MITDPGQAVLDQALSQPVEHCLRCTSLALNLDSTVLDTVEIIDNYASLQDACLMATTLNHRNRGKGVFYLVQRHAEEPQPEPGALEF